MSNVEEYGKRIDDNYMDFRDFDSGTNPPQLAGYGKSDFIRCPKGVRVRQFCRGIEGVTNYFKINGEDVFFRSAPVNFKGDLEVAAEYEGEAYVTTGEGIYKFIANKWETMFHGVNIWPLVSREIMEDRTGIWLYNQLANHTGKYIKSKDVLRHLQDNVLRAFEIRKPADPQEASLKNALGAARRRRLGSTGKYTDIFVLENLFDFGEAKANSLHVESKGYVEYVSAEKTGFGKGLETGFMEPSSPSFGLPVLLEADLMEIPLSEADINRTDRIKKSGQTKLSLSDARVFVGSVDEAELKKNWFGEGGAPFAIDFGSAPFFTQFGAVAAGCYCLLEGIREAKSIYNGVPFEFWNSAWHDVSDFGLPYLTIFGAVLGLDTLDSGIRYCKNRPVKVKKYGGNMGLKISGTEFLGEM